MEQNNPDNTPDCQTENVQPITVLDDYSVIVTERERLQEFFTAPENLDTLYGAIERKALALVADPATKEGIAAIKSCARQLASVKVKVDDVGKKVVADLKALPKVIDVNRAAFRARMEELQESIRRPVTEMEERQKEIADIRAIHLGATGDDPATLKTKLERVKAIDLSPERWKESLEEAKKAVQGETYALGLLIESAEKREKEAAELEELRRKQAEADRIIHEQKIKEEAERKAREEAETRAAAEKARLEREKAEAERRAAEAEKARKEAEERAKSASEISTAQCDIPENGNGTSPDGAGAAVSEAPNFTTKQPQKWTADKKAVNNAIVKAIAAIIEERLAGYTESGYELAAREIVKAVITGKINNLKVEY